MRQSEARDLRSFLKEPVEEIVVEGVKARSLDLQQEEPEQAQVGAPFTSPWGPGPTSPWTHDTTPRSGITQFAGITPWLGTTPWPQDTQRDKLQDTGAPIQEAGVKFISGANAQLLGTGVRFTTPWEGTGGQLHEVGARFTGPLLGTNPSGSNQRTTDDFTLQQTMPIARIASQQIVPGEPSPALQSWERRRHAIYTWLVLLLLFLLVVLGGIGLDSLIASYR